MASPLALSSSIPERPSSLTPPKSVAPVPAASAAPATSAPAPAATTSPSSVAPTASASAAAAPAVSTPSTSVTQPTSVPAPSIQRVSATQLVKSAPTGTTSPSNSQVANQNTNTRSSSSSGGKDISNSDATPDLPSASNSGSHAGPVGGAIVAILFVFLVLAGSFWLLRRRRQKFQRLWEAQRMPASNFGKFDNETIPEKTINIEATLAADLARLRSLDQQASMNCHNYDLDYTPKPVNPGGFKIARKPSYRANNPVALLSPSDIENIDRPELSPTAPAYDVKEYIADFTSKETGTSTLPKLNSSASRRNY